MIMYVGSGYVFIVFVIVILYMVLIYYGRNKVNSFFLKILYCYLIYNNLNWIYLDLNYF